MARTAMTKSKRGGQRDTATESMVQPVLKYVEEICMGNVLQPGAANTLCRMG